MRFCGGCGSALPRNCPRCGFSNPAGFKFCGDCAAPLTGAAPAAEPKAPPPAAAREAERRQLTVMFVDLVDSVGLSEAMDAEDLRDVVRAYQGVVVKAIEQGEGHIAQYLGDGILAYFGYPVAHEDDAVRAVRAGLHCIQGMDGLRVPLRVGQPIQIRVGIHTGVGVIGEMGAGLHHERLAIGSAPNIAARIQSLARPGEVLVSGVTRALAGDMFEYTDAQEHALKGVSRPVAVSRVLAEQGTQHQIAHNKRLGMRPLIGRDQPLAVLQAQMQAAQARRGSTVLVTGEAGIGKSRLIYAFASGLPADVLQLSARCAPYAQNSPLLPLVELFGQMFGVSPQTREGLDEERIRSQLASATDPDAFDLLAAFLSLRSVGHERLAALSSARRRDRTLQVLRDLLLREAADRALVVIVEDVHWLDPSSLEFIESLMDPGAQVGLMLVLTARPAFVSPWGFRPYLKKLELGRLAPAEAEALLRSVSGDKPLPEAVLKDLLARADGVPLYVEEITKAVIESGLLREGARGYELNLPATLRDSLAARLDHLGPAKGVAQLAAVIGRSFSYAVLAAISPDESRVLRRHMDQLVRAELIQLDESQRQETYVFRHALIRDAAYDSLLRREREDLHGRVATALQASAALEIQERPEILAWHLEGAGQVEAAVTSWSQAGQAAMARAAHREAIGHLMHAVDLLKRQPDSAERSQVELGLQLALGGNYIATQGWSSAGVMGAFSRARDLCESMGHERPVFPALWGLWSYHLVAGNFRDAREISDELRLIAERTADPGLLVPAGHASGYAFMFAGEYRPALELTTRGIALFEVERERELVRAYQQSSTSAMCNIASISLWALGHPDQARQLAVRDGEICALMESRVCDAWHYPSLLWGVATLLRDTAWVRDCEQKGLQAAADIENVFWPPLLHIVAAWARVMDGEHEALAIIEDNIRIWRAGGAGVLTTQFYALYLEACLVAGEHRRGIDFVPTAYEYVARSGENYFATEVHRLHGELLVAEAGADCSDEVLAAALAHVDAALTLCRAAQARSFELRAAMSRVRICRGRAQQADALAALAALYAGFDEGLETPDLKDAQALLQIT